MFDMKLVSCPGKIRRKHNRAVEERFRPPRQLEFIGGKNVTDDHQRDDQQWTARTAPDGPHSQVQNAMARKTASGLSVRRRPSTVGVMIWPSTVVSAIKDAGPTRAHASDGNVT
jgi:hypothetical protein